MTGTCEKSSHTEGLRRGAPPVDGILLVSFGGPRGPEDVMPFLENVTAGRGIPQARLQVVARHYYARGGVSPINAETEALVRAMEAALAQRGDRDVPVLLGNRNWTPTIDEALRHAAENGLRHLAVVLTSAYSGYSSCRQYRENVADAIARVSPGGPGLPRLSFVRPWGLAPEVVETWGRLAGEAARSALDEVANEGAGTTGESGAVRLVFVAHSIPETAAEGAGPPEARGAYVAQLTEVAERVVAHVEAELGVRLEWSLAYCSRSGRPGRPWLEPDISDELEHLASEGVRGVAVVPIGFVADHMEVVQDLDTVAAADAERLGLGWHRAPTLRDDPAVAGLLVEAALAAGESPALCPADCCAGGGRPGAERRPAAFEAG